MKTPTLSTCVLTFALILSLRAGISLLTAAPATMPSGEGWFALFNGKNLDGWTVKAAQHPIAVNHLDVFRVEDGIIKVSYDKYKEFDQQFAHLYTNSPYSRYVLRLEYLHTGTPMADAPEWAGYNSGVMIHSQSPLSMTVEQLWPASLEFQFLAIGTKAGRQTGNACTPGTNLVLKGELTTAHIIDSSAKLYPQDEWVTIEVEVHGNDEVIHRVNGAEVLRYEHPQLDPNDPDAQRLLAAGQPLQISFGHIALQAEGHPVWFRNIMLRPLEQ